MFVILCTCTVRVPTSSDSGGVYYMEGTGTLVVERAGSSDNGLYECTGSNQYGRASARTLITFNRPSKGQLVVGWMVWVMDSHCFSHSTEVLHKQVLGHYNPLCDFKIPPKKCMHQTLYQSVDSFHPFGDLLIRRVALF